MTTVEKIKAKILDIAIRGKLVPQNPDDEPASVLLGRIKAEKAKLVKAGKIKKDKNPSEIVVGSDGATYEKFADGKEKDISEEIPFELPQGWAWTRIGAVFYLQAGKNISSQCIKEHSSGYPYPCYGGNGVRGYVKKSSHKGIHAVIGRQGALCGNLNLTHDEFYATEHAVVVETFSEVTADFAYWFLKQMNLNQYATATAQPGLSVREIVDVMFPLPPLAEQKRIVAKIEELFAYVDKIGEASDGITQAAQRLDKKILDLAIRGQLVPQDPNDEPACELIKRIEAVKKITEKGRKSSRAAASDRPAYETEAPFDIPDSWAWVRLRDVCNTISKGTTPKGGNKAYSKTGVTFIRAENVCSDGQLRIDNAKFINEQTHRKELSRSILEDGDLLITIAGSLGRSAVVSSDALPANANQAVAFARPCDPQLSQYLQKAVMAMRRMLLSQQKVTGVPNLTLESISNLYVPLPPLAEQKRIVAKIEELRAMTRSFTT